jgi:peptidoglycan hydrolase-like protein with peptidoglycan-binding domain
MDVARVRLTAVVLLALALGVAAKGSAAAQPDRVPVFFLQGEQLVKVLRNGSTAADAVHRLIAGLTRVERKRSLRTYVPPGTTVHNVTVANGLATVDLGRQFVVGRDARNLLARLSQLVRTLTGIEGTTQVQLLIDGAPVSGVFPGVPTAGPITFRYLQTPNVPLPKPRREKLGPPNARIKQAQQRLISLGYLLRGADDGRFGPITQEGILAFQKWEKLSRSALLDSATERRLATALHPTPLTRRGAGKRAEILLDRQVALLISSDQVVRTIAVSSGKASTPTPAGNYKVYAKIPRWWSVPFREWLPWALPFVGGIAFHQYSVVPAFPASHGCVRQTVAVAVWTYNFATVGMPVSVISRS